jgi:hypothetical protein
MISVFKERLLPLWFDFIGASAQHPFNVLMC